MSPSRSQAKLRTFAPAVEYTVASRVSGSNLRFVAFGQRATQSFSVVTSSGRTVRDILLGLAVCSGLLRVRKIATDERMPLNTSLLAALTIAAFGIHAVAILVAFFLLYNSYKDVIPFIVNKMSLLIIITFTALVGSFLINLGLLTALQWNTCSAVKDITGIAFNAAKPLFIVLGFALLPTQSEWLRLAISQITQFVPGMKPHMPLEMKNQGKINQEILDAGTRIADLATGTESHPPFAPLKGETGVLDSKTFNLQTFWELSFSCAYMAAFGGAIAFAWGSWSVVKC